MNKDFERCCSFLADMIIKYAPEIKEEVEVCMMIKDIKCQDWMYKKYYIKMYN